MVEILKEWLSYKLDADQLEVKQLLIDNPIASRRVVGRGTLVMDGKEVVKTEKFKQYSKAAKEIVQSVTSSN